MNQQLIDYIHGQLALGVSKENIAASLRKQGWQEADITTALSAADIFPKPERSFLSKIVLGVSVITGLIIIGGFIIGGIAIQRFSTSIRNSQDPKDQKIRQVFSQTVSFITIAAQVEQYKKEHGTYPATINDMPGVRAAVPVDAAGNPLLTYEVQDGGTWFKICMNTDGKIQCVPDKKPVETH
jgi:hypothetical protein